MNRPVLAFLFLCVTMVWLFYSCNKNDALKGCKSSKEGFSCTINGEKFTADSMGCKYDSAGYNIYLYARDTSIASTIFLTIRYTMQSLDLPIRPTDTVYRAKLECYYKNQYFKADYGNIGLDVDLNNVCGQFFAASSNPAININAGKFTNIIWTYWKP